MQIHPQDNVLVALQDLEMGQTISFNQCQIRLQQAVPAKHKFTLTALDAGAEVFMYGVLVGKTTQALAPGSRISTDNQTLLIPKFICYFRQHLF